MKRYEVKKKPTMQFTGKCLRKNVRKVGNYYQGKTTVV